MGLEIGGIKFEINQADRWLWQRGVEYAAVFKAMIAPIGTRRTYLLGNASARSRNA